MNVSCSNCPAKYAVPDAKVRGKKVRMVCRHCGATIAIDGASLGAETGGESGESGRPALAASARPSGLAKPKTVSFGAATPVAAPVPKPAPAPAAAKPAPPAKSEPASPAPKSASVTPPPKTERGISAPQKPIAPPKTQKTLSGMPPAQVSAPPPSSDDWGWPDVAPASAPPPVAVKPELVSKLPRPARDAAPPAAKPPGSAATPTSSSTGAAAIKPKRPEPKPPAAPEPKPDTSARMGADGDALPAPPGRSPPQTKSSAPASDSVSSKASASPALSAGKSDAPKPAERSAEPPKPFAGRPAVVVSSKASGTTSAVSAPKGRSLKKTIVGGLEGPAGSMGGRATGASPPSRPLPPRAEPKPAGSRESLGVPEWTVAINDRDHTEMSTRQLVELYAIGAISHETFVWKPGMETWKTPFSIPPVAHALEDRGFRRPDESSVAVPRPRPADPNPPLDEEATVIQQTNLKSLPSLGGGWREPGTSNMGRVPPAFGDRDAEEVTVATDSRKLLSQLESSPPSSNRLLKPYTAEPHSSDVATVARGQQRPERINPPSEAPAPPRPGPRPPSPGAKTGELSQPTVYDEPTRLRSPDEPVPEALDAMALVNGVVPAPVRGEEMTAKRPPEVMAGYARDFEVQAVEGVPPIPSVLPERWPADHEPPRRKSRVGLWLLGALALLGGAAAGLYFLQPELVAHWVGILKQQVSDAMPAPSAPTPGVAPVRSAPVASASAPAPAASASQTAPAMALDAGVDAAPEGSLADASVDSAAAYAGPFNKKAAWGALNVAAGNVGKCAADPEAEKVTGEVMVTFVSSGKVSFVEVKGELKGNPAEGCVAQTFRRITVPPFSGEPVYLARNVSVPP